MRPAQTRTPPASPPSGAAGATQVTPEHDGDPGASLPLDSTPGASLPLDGTPGASFPLDFDVCYRAIAGRDPRWDGRVFLGVSSTRIYCRPSCPARKPKPQNCRFFASAAACVAAGFRACKRCRPDAIPGTRDWDARGDLAARAVRRIRDGAVDSVGVTGLARELAVSERHLRRVLIAEVGASPLQLARTRRAHAARTLIDQTDLPLADIAFAAGFGSLRQFGDTMREEFGDAPSRLPRNGRGARTSVSPGGSAADPASDERPRLALQLRGRAPYDVAGMRAFLVAHAIPGRDAVECRGREAARARSRDAAPIRSRDAVGADPLAPTAHAIDVPGGTATAEIGWEAVREERGTVAIPVALTLPILADTMPAIATVRRLLDLDADPAQIGGALGPDPRLAPLLSRRPGLRLPGARNPQEFALGTVLGQQVSLAAARTLQGRLAEAFSVAPPPGSASEFRPAPDAAGIADTDPAELRERLGLTRARAETLRDVARALATGLDLGPGADRGHARAELAALRGIGPWSVELIAMRALGDPDAFPAGDLILRRALGARTDRETRSLAEAWRPFRGYATQHLWADFLAAQAAATASRSVPHPTHAPGARP
ncbi:DNA-3-methyladenine glycosylase 2 family protein [Leucobacter weissii]|uniref:DNA-3-methyladenine glycosylase II n=1 Tax=Leucobacter weissii TaxID=1983706 RepID=A0A939MID6_9MICO|nr:Ada metal-binding domain-containing protein [Leucobacter weissii]MBO1900800.1 DNA-3-methyladenine glycosylase 2 family protein [Leucobacter weissii]